MHAGSVRHEYFASLQSRIQPGRAEQILRDIHRTGRWERIEEVALHKYAERLIERVEEASTVRYHVRVSIDMICECWCPNLERAIQYLDVIEAWIGDLFSELGRPSLLPSPDDSADSAEPAK